MESSFRATRDGVQATLLHNEALRPVGEIATEVLQQVRPYAQALQAEAALDEVQWLLTTGGGATRQRCAHARWGMQGLLQLLVAETGER